MVIRSRRATKIKRCEDFVTRGEAEKEAKCSGRETCKEISE